MRMSTAITLCFFFQAEDGIRDLTVTGVQTCALPISVSRERLSKYSTATLFRSGAAGRVAPWHGGVEPSGHCANRPVHVDTTATGRRSQANGFIAARPAVATPPPASGSGGSPEPSRTRANADQTRVSRGAARPVP